MVGVGLLYQLGYFKQSLTRDGWQQETYPVLDPVEMPLSLLREPDGSPAKVDVSLPGGRTLSAHVWKAQVGRVPLLLLDSDDRGQRRRRPGRHRPPLRRRRRAPPAAGDAARRSAASGPLRLWSRLSGAPAPDVYHTNEGHAGFLGLERIRELVQAGTDSTSSEALEVGPVGHGVHHPHPRPGRHRPVRAGPDADLLRRRQRRWAASRSTRSCRSARRTTPAGTRRSSTWR